MTLHELELELTNTLRRQFPGHSVGGRLPHWIDELWLTSADVRFQVERLWASRDAWREQAQRLAQRVLDRRWWWSRTDAT
jgi:hypothetical protein